MTAPARWARPDAAGADREHAPTPMADFLSRAGRGLRPVPPVPGDRRSDPRGDHSLDPGPFTAPAESPRAAAVLVPVVARPDGPTVLLTERASTLRQHGGQVAFPGGRVDPEDPSVLAAALREAVEEISLHPRHVRALGYLDAYLSGTNYLIVPVVALVEPPFDLQPNPAEVESVFEVPLAFLMDERNHELHAREWRRRVRTYYAIPFGSRYIWGVTAGILRNMHERLYGP